MSQKPAVIITGAGSGIGKTTAELFSQNGHDVVLVGRTKSKLEETAKKLKSNSLVVTADMTVKSQCEEVIKQAFSKFEYTGILINNAAIYEYKRFLKHTEKDWKNIFETNLFGPIHLMESFIPLVVNKKKAVVINVASTAGLRPVENVAAYSTSKAALIYLTQALALEYAKDQIQFHAICPGVVDTPIHNDDGTKMKAMASIHPMGRVGESHDVAKAIYYLATQTSWMTGVVLPVDGGLSLK